MHLEGSNFLHFGFKLKSDIYTSLRLSVSICEPRIQDSLADLWWSAPLGAHPRIPTSQSHQYRWILRTPQYSWNSSWAQSRQWLLTKFVYSWFKYLRLMSTKHSTKYWWTSFDYLERPIFWDCLILWSSIACMFCKYFDYS